MLQRSEWLYNLLNQRRSVRIFSDDPVPKKVIENIILTAGTAPSGAHKQPWHFCVVSDPDIKAQIRVAAEKEEYENYTRRMSHRWLEDLKPFGTDHLKPFLEIAPYLIVVMKKPYEVDSEGKKINNYYVNESVGLATGMLLAAIHNAGLISLTHTPSPMRFLRKILKSGGPPGFRVQRSWTPDSTGRKRPTEHVASRSRPTARPERRVNRWQNPRACPA
jgi:iodotyrosine deiodinase